MRKILTILLIVTVAMFFAGSINAKGNDDVKLRVFVHYPKAAPKPATVAACTPTVNDQVNNYGLAGWHLPAAGVTYKINYGTVPSSVGSAAAQQAMASGFTAWSNADSEKVFKYGGATTAKNAKRDYQNIVAWGAIRSGAIAITYIWYYTSTGEVAEVDTIFNKLLKWSWTDPSTTTADCVSSATYDVQNIATHEFGHWVGLDDLYDTASQDLTMYGYGTTGELKKNTLGLGDYNGTNVILP